MKKMLKICLGMFLLSIVWGIPVSAAQITSPAQVIGTWDGTYQGNWQEPDGTIVRLNRHVTFSLSNCTSSGAVKGIVYVAAIPGETYQVSGSYYCSGDIDFSNGFIRLAPEEWKKTISAFNKSCFRGTINPSTKSFTGYRTIGNWTGTGYTFNTKKIDNNSSAKTITSVTLSKTTLKLSKGNSCTLKYSIMPNDLTGVSLKWTSSNSSVVTVSSSGLMTAKAPGTAVIKLTASYNGSSKSASCTVTVPQPTKYNYKGTITDATTGSKLSGATVNIRKGSNVKSGTIYASTSTSSLGQYLAKLEKGTYTLEIKKSGYVTTYITISCNGNSATYSENTTSISKPIASAKYRIVLSWGAAPRDLDSHLTGPKTGGGRYHIYYRAKKPSGANANLDIDDTTSYGPETVTLDLSKSKSGTYEYFVHDYSNRSQNGSTAMSKSGAKVMIYRGSSHVKTYYVPKNKVGNVWRVFKIVNGEIKTVNTMSTQSGVPTAGVSSALGSRNVDKK